MIKILLVALVVLVLLIAIAVAIGYSLPQGHVVSRSILLKQKRDAVYAVVSDLKGAPSWRTGITAMVEVKGEGGETLYKETSRQGVLHYRVAAAEPPGKFVTAIAEKNAPFGGSWTIALSETPQGTRVVITENGEVYNPFFRFMAKFVFGHHKTMEAYLRDLAVKFSEEAVTRE